MDFLKKPGRLLWSDETKLKFFDHNDSTTDCREEKSTTRRIPSLTSKMSEACRGDAKSIRIEETMKKKEIYLVVLDKNLK